MTILQLDFDSFEITYNQSIMSVKLPLILHGESNYNDSPESPHNNPQTPPKEPSPSKDPEDHYEEQYEDHEFEELEEPEVIENKEPIETVTVLKVNKGTEEGILNVSVEEESSKKGQELQQLQQMLQNRVKTVSEYQLRISEKKKEIKEIGQKVDKDLNKSLLRATRQQSVNIRDIFSATPVKSGNHKVNALNEELKKIRFTIKQVKQEISKLQGSLADPVLVMNEERGIQAKSKMRSTEQDIKTIEHEKALLEQQISRGEKDFNQQEDKQRADDLQRLAEELAEISSSQRQEKLNLYRLQKEDIFLMEKNKFFQEREGHIGSRKQSKLPPKDKDKLQKEIKELIVEINNTIEDRNRTQTEKKQQTKSLSSEISTLQTKNWELFNRLRQVDAFLLQHYEKKSRRKEIKPLEKTVDVMEKSASGKVDSQTIVSEHLYKSKLSQNDKNFKPGNDKNLVVSEVKVEKKKNYEFGYKEEYEGQINLSDQFLGPKLNIKRLTLNCDHSSIYSVQAHYDTSFGNEVVGLMMGSKTGAEKGETLSLQLSANQVINFGHFGYQENKLVSFVQLVTSEGKELKWGSLDGLIKSQQKHIKHYQNCYLKTKIVLSSQEDEEKNRTQLVGLTFATTYLAPK